jgi:anti-anti-sigma regulatory factor
MLKIMTIQENLESLRLELYGEFTAESLPELEKALSGQRTDTRKITLDLSQVNFVDRAGMKYLRGAQSQHIALENLPSYVSRWMEQEGRNGAAMSSTSESQSAGRQSR